MMTCYIYVFVFILVIVLIGCAVWKIVSPFAQMSKCTTSSDFDKLTPYQNCSTFESNKQALCKEYNDTLKTVLSCESVCQQNNSRLVNDNCQCRTGTYIDPNTQNTCVSFCQQQGTQLINGNCLKPEGDINLLKRVYKGKLSSGGLTCAGAQNQRVVQLEFADKNLPEIDDAVKYLMYSGDIYCVTNGRVSNTQVIFDIDETDFTRCINALKESKIVRLFKSDENPAEFAYNFKTKMVVLKNGVLSKNGSVSDKTFDVALIQKEDKESWTVYGARYNLDDNVFEFSGFPQLADFLNSNFKTRRFSMYSKPSTSSVRSDFNVVTDCPIPKGLTQKSTFDAGSLYSEAYNTDYIFTKNNGNHVSYEPYFVIYSHQTFPSYQYTYVAESKTIKKTLLANDTTKIISVGSFVNIEDNWVFYPNWFLTENFLEDKTRTSLSQVDTFLTVSENTPMVFTPLDFEIYLKICKTLCKYSSAKYTYFDSAGNFACIAWEKLSDVFYYQGRPRHIEKRGYTDSEYWCDFSRVGQKNDYCGWSGNYPDRPTHFECKYAGNKVSTETSVSNINRDGLCERVGDSNYFIGQYQTYPESEFVQILTYKGQNQPQNDDHLVDLHDFIKSNIDKDVLFVSTKPAQKNNNNIDVEVMQKNSENNYEYQPLYELQDQANQFNKNELINKNTPPNEIYQNVPQKSDNKLWYGVVAKMKRPTYSSAKEIKNIFKPIWPDFEILPFYTNGERTGETWSMYDATRSTLADSSISNKKKFSYDSLLQSFQTEPLRNMFKCGTRPIQAVTMWNPRAPSSDLTASTYCNAMTNPSVGKTPKTFSGNNGFDCGFTPITDVLIDEQATISYNCFGGQLYDWVKDGDEKTIELSSDSKFKLSVEIACPVGISRIQPVGEGNPGKIKYQCVKPQEKT